MRTMTAAALVLCTSVAALAAEGNSLTVHKRSRVEQPGGTWTVQEKAEAWRPAETAIIVCDMCDSHHCLNAVRRAVEMAPRMNAVLTKARESGVLIIHAPSGCMETYQHHPGRKLAQTAPTAATLPADIGQWCRVIPAEEKGTYPIDQTTRSEDDDLSEHQVWQDKLAALARIGTERPPT